MDSFSVAPRPSLHMPASIDKLLPIESCISVSNSKTYLGFLICHSGADKLISSSQSPSFFALIIGINEYASPVVCRPLKGTISDAFTVRKYLEEHLGVPRSQIHLLLDAEATRSAIIQAFNNLVADQRIQRGDPILIFYAGHGSEVDPPKHWEAGSTKIQMLILHNFGINVDGRVIYGILDRTIGVLLARVAE